MHTDPERRPLLTTVNDAPPTDDVHALVDTPKEPAITWRSETALVLRQTTPLIATYLLQYFFSITVVIVCATLSTDELAAVSLGLTTSNIIGLAIWEGMATALDTLCAQAYGSGNYQMVGMHVLRFTVFVHLVAIPIAGLWLCSPWILPYLTPSRELAANASLFLQWYTIGIPGYASFEAGKRFLQSQGNFTSGLLVLLICVPINIFLNWLLVFHLDLRIFGAALAAALTNLIRPFLLVLDIILFRQNSWYCWPSQLKWRSLFANWKPMASLALPGVIMTMSEWLAFEALTFATSYAGTEQLAAQTFLATISVIVWHVHFSGSVVTSTRIGKLIGGGYLEQARTVSVYYVYIFLAFAAFDLVLFTSFIEVVLHFLTHDQVVATALQGTLPFAIVFTFFDCMSTCMHGIVRGLGWHSIGGWVTGLVNYVYAVPLALFLELGPPALGVRGVWLSLGSGLALISIIEGCVLRYRSWNSVVEEAKRRQFS